MKHVCYYCNKVIKKESLNTISDPVSNVELKLHTKCVLECLEDGDIEEKHIINYAEDYPNVNKKLKPCPFCGSDLTLTDESPIYGISYYHVENQCLLSDNLFWVNQWGGQDEFITKWNKRVNNSK